MSRFVILYDAEQAEAFESEIKPLLPWEDCEFLAYDGQRLDDYAPECPVLFWLSDDRLYELLPLASRLEWVVGFIPHSDMNRIHRSFAIPKNPTEAIEAIASVEKPVMADLMVCNQQLVLSSVMLGNPDMMKPAAMVDENLWCKLKNVLMLILSLSKMCLLPYKMVTAKDSKVNTAALGITVVYRPSASEFTKRVVGETQLDEATLNAVILAPRSLSEVLRFLLTKVLPKKVEAKGVLPNYVGHIKTERLLLSGSGELDFSIDGQYYKAQEVLVEVQSNALKLLSPHLPEKSPDNNIKESVRVAKLPKGEAVKALVNRPLPLIHHADQDEVKEVFVTLRENAQASEAYMVLMVLATLLATVGLFANSAPVIIGAMILAPLMSPIISLSMGVLRQNVDLVTDSAKTLGIGVLLALIFGTLFTLITPLSSVNSEISARLSPTLLDLGVAIISGIAAAYASARSEVAKSLAGVAIAVALVPPLAVSSIGIGWWDWPVFWGAFLLFLTNLAGIVLAAAATFLFLGFSPFGLAKKGLLLSLAFVAMVSVPLVFAFSSLVQEQRLASALKGFQMAGIVLKDVNIRSGEPMLVSAKLVSDRSLQDAQIEAVKREIEARLGRPIQLEAVTAVLK
ncbi:MAG: TIGR00341 family protein [Hydrogenovibrio sp.]